MYNCKMCKALFTDDPALVNGTGEYCIDCKGVILSRSLRGRIEANKQFEGMCLWCGVEIDKSTAVTGKLNEHVCYNCVKGRDWLLSVIRFSDRAAKYAKKTEERESPERERRKANTLVIETRLTPKTETQNKTEDRLARLESILIKISSELGI
jgi:hypothetical protein